MKATTNVLPTTTPPPKTTTNGQTFPPPPPSFSDLLLLFLHNNNNNNNYQYTEFLKYKYMAAFDRAMNHLDKAFGFVSAPNVHVSKTDEGDKVLVFERGDLVFVFNWHPHNSYTDYRIGCYLPGTYKLVLSSDEAVFGGFSRVTKSNDTLFFSQPQAQDGRPRSFQVYAPSRTVVVYAPSDWCDKDADAGPLGVPGLAVKGLGPYFAR